MCNLYTITTNQAAIQALFRVVNRYVGNLPAMPSVFPDYTAPVVRNAVDGERELTMMRWGMPPPPRAGGPPVTNVRNTALPRPPQARLSISDDVRSPLQVEPGWVTNTLIPNSCKAKSF